MTQKAYINQMLDRFGMAECKSVGAPAEGVLTRISAEKGGRPDKQYMSIVGSLLYAAMITRPDITYAVQALGRHLQSSGEEHMIAAKRVLRYLQGTKDLGLVYEAKGDGAGQPSLVGFSDADWGGDKDTRRSTTGYLFMIEESGGVISWGSKLQPTVALPVLSRGRVYGSVRRSTGSYSLKAFDAGLRIRTERSNSNLRG